MVSSITLKTLSDGLAITWIGSKSTWGPSPLFTVMMKYLNGAEGALRMLGAFLILIGCVGWSIGFWTGIITCVLFGGAGIALIISMGKQVGA